LTALQSITAADIDRMAREWYGYGTWDAPFWFIGMEPGGSETEDNCRYWLELGAGELIDCREHHLRAKFTDWHKHNPPTQDTWRGLIRFFLAFQQKPFDLRAVSDYQERAWGAKDGATAVIELSALSAAGLHVNVDRKRSRDDRIEHIRERLLKHQPTIALFYGITYREHWQAIVGSTFDSRGFAYVGRTLCIEALHPTRGDGQKERYWYELAKAARDELAGSSRESA
jgi:hypothetical protein